MLLHKKVPSGHCNCHSDELWDNPIACCQCCGLAHVKQRCTSTVSCRQAPGPSMAQLELEHSCGCTHSQEDMSCCLCCPLSLTLSLTETANALKNYNAKGHKREPPTPWISHPFFQSLDACMPWHVWCLLGLWRK